MKIRHIIIACILLAGCSNSYIGKYQSNSFLVELKHDSTFFYSVGENGSNCNTGYWTSNNDVISFDADVKKIEGFGLMVKEYTIDSIVGTKIALRNYLNEPMPTAYLYYNGDTLIKNIFVDSVFNFKAKLKINSFNVRVFNNGEYVNSEVYNCRNINSNYFSIKLQLPECFDQNTFQCLDTVKMKYRCNKLYLIHNNKTTRVGIKKSKRNN